MDVPHLRLAPALAPRLRRGRPREIESAIRVVLADDHSSMRRSLRLLLDFEDDIEVVAEAGDLAAVGRHVDAYQPHVLVLDLGMADGSSSDAIGGLRRRAPETQIVIVTMEQSPVFAQRALAAGAVGFVLKDLAAEGLPHAIRLATWGAQYASPRLVLALDDMHRALAEDNVTVREVEVLRLIARGHTSGEIASRLRLSPRTVEADRARIHRKLGLATHAELVRYALGRGLLRT